MNRPPRRSPRPRLAGPIFETLTTLIAVVLGFYLLGNGLKVGGHTLFAGAGGMPAMTPYLFSPHDAAGIGTLLRFIVYTFLTLILAWLGLRILVAFMLARQSGFSTSSRLLAFFRLAPVRGAGATIGTFMVTAGGGAQAHAATVQMHQAARPAMVSNLSGSQAASDTAFFTQAPAARDQSFFDASKLVTSPNDAFFTSTDTSARHDAVAHSPSATSSKATVVKQASERVIQPVTKSMPALQLTVGPGDTLSGYSEQFYGTPYRFMDIYNASHNIVQADGATMSNPNDLSIGWKVNIPLPASNVTLNGTTPVYTVQDGDTASGIAQRFYGDWSKYSEIVTASRGLPQPNGMVLSGDGSIIQPGMILQLPNVQTVGSYKAPAVLKPTIKPKAQVAPKHQVKALVHHAIAPQKVHHVSDVVAPDMPLRGIAPAPAPRTVPEKAQSNPVILPVGQSTHLPPVQTPDGQHRTSTTATAIPLGNYLIPVMLLALLFIASGAVLLRRRRGEIDVPSGNGHILGSMLDAMHAAKNGLPSPTLQAVKKQMSGNEGPRVAFVLAALQQTGGPLGMGIDLVRTAIERTDGIDVNLAVRGINADRRTRLADALGRRLGVAVGVQPGVDSDGTPVITLSVAQGMVPASAAPYPTPAPLVLPVGRTSSGDMVYVNLSQTDSLLIAGTDQGPSGLMRVLMTSLVMQSSPDQVKLLVASRDQSLRSSLAATQFLVQDPIDPDNITDLSNLIARADAISMDRFTADEDPSSLPYIVVLIDDIENIAGSPSLCENLQALCRQGRDSKIHVIATSGAPSALVDSGLMDLFHTRLAFHLDPVQSQEIFSDETVASDLNGREIYLHGVGPDQTLSALELDRSVMEDMIARHAIATLPETVKSGGMPPAPAMPVTAAQGGYGGDEEFFAPQTSFPAGNNSLDDAPSDDFYKSSSWDQNDPWQEQSAGAPFGTPPQPTTNDYPTPNVFPPATQPPVEDDGGWGTAAWEQQPPAWTPPVEASENSAPQQWEQQAQPQQWEQQAQPQQWEQQAQPQQWEQQAQPQQWEQQAQPQQWEQQAQPQQWEQQAQPQQWEQQAQPQQWEQQAQPQQWEQQAQPQQWEQQAQAQQWEQQAQPVAESEAPAVEPPPAEDDSDEGGWSNSMPSTWTPPAAVVEQQQAEPIGLPQHADIEEAVAAATVEPMTVDTWSAVLPIEAEPAPSVQDEPEQEVIEVADAPVILQTHEDDQPTEKAIVVREPAPIAPVPQASSGPVRLRDDSVREALVPFDTTARLEIRMINGVNIYLDGQPVTATFREQPIIILGIIGLLGPGPVAAETIIDRLAQQGPPVHRNAKTVARAISRLREHLQSQGLDDNPVVWSNAGGYELARGIATCDLYNLVKLKERMNTVDRDDRHFLWERFVDRYEGEVWKVSRPNWVTAYSERWHKEYVNYLYRLANWHLEQGNDPNEALIRAQELFDEEPLEERSAILMIDLLGEKGDMTGLEEFYTRLSAVRVREGGAAEPSQSEQNHFARWKQRMNESA